MCPLRFFFPCFSVHVLSDAVVNSLAFYSSVLTPQLLLYYILIMSLHFCTPCTLTARTLTNLVLVAKDQKISAFLPADQASLPHKNLTMHSCEPTVLATVLVRPATLTVSVD